MAHPGQHYGHRTKTPTTFERTVGAVEDYLAEAFPCTCTSDYTIRSMEDPQCDYHDLQWLAKDIAVAALQVAAPGMVP